MSDQDVSTTTYFEDPAHCADLLNGFSFHGKQYVLPEHIQIKNQNSSMPNTKDKKKQTITIYRDIVMEAKIQMKTAIITLENQSDIHYAMPVRIMTGDSSNYYNQWRTLAKKHREQKDLEGMEFLSEFSKNDKLIPLSTIVVYFGDTPWDGPRCLKDMLDLEGLPPEMIDAIEDYPINLLEVRNYPDYENFQTDFRLVCGFLQRDKDSKALHSYVMENSEQFLNLPEDAFALINHYSHSNYFIESKDTYETKTGGINMCKAIDDLIAQGEARGKEMGIELGIESIIKLCQEFSISTDLALQRIMTDFSLTNEKAHEYVKKYWV